MAVQVIAFPVAARIPLFAIPLQGNTLRGFFFINIQMNK